MEGFVYFITMEPDEYVKIGFTRQNPHSRKDTLQTGCPHALHLRAYFPATMEEERRLHETFEPLRGLGEWFFLQDKLADLVWYMENTQSPACSRQAFEGAIIDCVLGDAGPWAVSETCDPSWWEYLMQEEAL